MNREQIDFHQVSLIHEETHERLLNWARWVRPNHARSGLQPMFRQYRSTETVSDPQQARIPVDPMDGHEVEKVVTSLPEKHMVALQWSYVYPWVPLWRVRRELAVTEAALNALMDGGRSMVKNRLKSISIRVRMPQIQPGTR